MLLYHVVSLAISTYFSIVVFLLILPLNRIGLIQLLLGVLPLWDIYIKLNSDVAWRNQFSLNVIVVVARDITGLCMVLLYEYNRGGTCYSGSS